MIRTILFLTCLLIIVSVSAVDTYLNIKYPPTLATEENPVARELIRADDGHALLIALKLLFTSLVAAFLVAYSYYKREQAHLIGGGVALLQLGVLFYIIT
jgi:hypothetical protein